MPPDSTPFADWPRHLQASWHDCAERGEVDAQNPPHGMIDAYKHEHDTDISALYERESISISDFVTSLKHDTRLVRESKGTPQHVNIYGYLYNIDTNELSLVVEDKGPTAA